jgi:hypothetical protein
MAEVLDGEVKKVVMGTIAARIWAGKKPRT